jgi:hypothetical protein
MDAPGTAVRIAAIFAKILTSISLSMLSLTVQDVLNARMKAVNKSFRERTIAKDTLGLLVYSNDALQLADLVDGILHLCFTQIGYLGHRMRRIGSDYVNSPYRPFFLDDTYVLDDTAFLDDTSFYDYCSKMWAYRISETERLSLFNSWYLDNIESGHSIDIDFHLYTELYSFLGGTDAKRRLLDNTVCTTVFDCYEDGLDFSGIESFHAMYVSYQVFLPSLVFLLPYRLCFNTTHVWELPFANYPPV